MNAVCLLSSRCKSDPKKWYPGCFGEAGKKISSLLQLSPLFSPVFYSQQILSPPHIGQQLGSHRLLSMEFRSHRSLLLWFIWHFFQEVCFDFPVSSLPLNAAIVSWLLPRDSYHRSEATFNYLRPDSVLRLLRSSREQPANVSLGQAHCLGKAHLCLGACHS